MTYQATKHTVYIVHWPDLGIVKVGYSLHQRWRTFVNRGAVVVDLVEVDSRGDGYALEALVLAAFAKRCGPAFESQPEADPYLAGRGAGWRECFKLPAGVSPMDILTHNDWTAAA
ncbi:hypothetical protein [Mycolicibacterium canariasense]|uniref:hypothetical protein n=1 Tax=Mycolicibacterium canariasense TaxID=228230 RepID=UPI0032D596DF